MDQADLEKVDAAIEAHGQWVAHLRAAIEHGTSDFSPDVVKTDNACVFGKWLYGSFPAHLKGTPTFEEIRALHAKFHQHAGNILSLAIGGKKTEATSLLLSSGEFMNLSGSLMLKLRNLRRS